MTTKNEFERQWNDCREDVKKIRLTNGDCVFATGYLLITQYLLLQGLEWEIGVFKFENIKGIECD